MTLSLVQFILLIASSVKLSSVKCPGQQRHPAGIITSFLRKVENLACDGTTISFGPGFLHMKQYEWLFDVEGIERDSDGGLY